MSEVSERYRRLTDAFAAKVAAVPADKWDAGRRRAPDWTTRDVVVATWSTRRACSSGFVGKELGDIPSVDDDPVAAWDAARRRSSASSTIPQRATAEFDGFLGRTTFEAAVDRFLCVDQVVHGWDLARAAGLDERIATDDIACVQQAGRVVRRCDAQPAGVRPRGRGARRRRRSGPPARVPRPHALAGLRAAGTSPQGDVSTPIIWKPLITARGFIVPGAQW